MPIGQPTSPVVTAKAQALLASGMTQGQVAQEVGLCRKTVNELAQKHRETINQLALDLIVDNAQVVRENTRLTLNKAHKLLKSGSRKQIQENNVLLYLADRKEQRMLQMTGILGSHAPSVVINQLFEAERGQSDSWRDLKEYGEFLAYKRDQDIQEAEEAEFEDVVEGEAQNEADSGG